MRETTWNIQVRWEDIIKADFNTAENEHIYMKDVEFID
jgi:hypothetical protein